MVGHKMGNVGVAGIILVCTAGILASGCSSLNYSRLDDFDRYSPDEISEEEMLEKEALFGAALEVEAFDDDEFIPGLGYFRGSKGSVDEGVFTVEEVNDWDGVLIYSADTELREFTVCVESAGDFYLATQVENSSKGLGVLEPRLSLRPGHMEAMVWNGKTKEDLRLYTRTQKPRGWNILRFVLREDNVMEMYYNKSLVGEVDIEERKFTTVILNDSPDRTGSRIDYIIVK